METRSIGSLISRLPSRSSDDDGKSERTTVVVRSLFLKVADVSEEKRQKTGEEKVERRSEGCARDSVFQVLNTLSGNRAKQKH